LIAFKKLVLSVKSSPLHNDLLTDVLQLVNDALISTWLWRHYRSFTYLFTCFWLLGKQYCDFHHWGYVVASVCWFVCQQN